MSYGQYCRIETLAGGVGCTNREFIRAAHTLLAPTGKTRDQREARHQWLREGLAHLANSRSLVAQFRL